MVPACINSAVNLLSSWLLCSCERACEREARRHYSMKQCALAQKKTAQIAQTDNKHGRNNPKRKGSAYGNCRLLDMSLMSTTNSGGKISDKENAELV